MSSYVNVVIPPLAQEFTYSLPENLPGEIEVGSQVQVPFGKRTVLGFVVSTFPGGKRPEHLPDKVRVRDVSNLPLSSPTFQRDQLEFFQWVADYYCASLSTVIDVAIPPASPPRFKRTVVSSESPATARGKLQKEILTIIHENGGSVDYTLLQKRFRGAAACLRRMREREIVRIDGEELCNAHLQTEPIPEWTKKSVSLNEAQEDACAKISQAVRAREFKTFLLHGVTGSGKTEVYLEAIKAVCDQGGGAIVIVPEIALTPQLIDRFRARLGDNIAILHSGLTRRARWDSWRSLLDGRSAIAVGARSGVFAPVEDLSLIIVDEEHDPSYKQSDGLRYNARDMAVLRGKLSKCPVVLGSATPSLESLHRALTGKYELLKLPERHSSGSSLSVEVINMNSYRPWEMPSRSITPPLHQAIEEALQRNKQSFLLYNRRGFASYLHCEHCEAALECPNCSVTLTYHQERHRIQCHYCNLILSPPEFCPSCQGPESTEPPRLVHRGSGTERVMEEVQELFPEASVDRLDRDTVSSEADYRRILQRVRNGESQILVGTQMIAKGHDLPNVTVVGVVDCDVGLHMPDFRAGERVFQLLTQASGRAGRGEDAGSVFLQTRVPRHPAIEFTKEQNFSGFARQELASRKAIAYPPFVKILRILASSQQKELPARLLHDYTTLIAELGDPKELGFQLLGPTPAPLEKLKTQWRWHLLVKSYSSTVLNRIVRLTRSMKLPSNSLKVVFDIDPQDLL